MGQRSKSRSGDAGERAAFGFRDVDIDDKQGMVDGVFDHVAGSYDLMNDLMSGGMHRLWKSDLVTWLGPPATGTRPYRVLDIAGGTGDIALRIAERSASSEITVLDISPAMLAIGRKRADQRRFGTHIRFVEGNAEILPLSSGRFDAVTIAFGIRNVPRIDLALSEAYRVLAPGGRLVVLEFSQVDIAVLEELYDFYSFNVIPRLGEFVTGDGDAYRYLVESIRRFPSQARFADMIRDAGFGRVGFRNLSGGIAALHSGWRL